MNRTATARARAVPGEGLAIIYEGKVTLVNARKSRHWAKNAAENKTLREWAGWAAVEAKVGDLSPVTIIFQLTTRTAHRVDVDACQGASKPIIDGLVDAGVMPDDNGDHVKSISYFAPVHTGVDSLRVIVTRSRG